MEKEKSCRNLKEECAHCIYEPDHTDPVCVNCCAERLTVVQPDDTGGKQVMFAIGNDELSKLPSLEKYISCSICGKRHIVRYGDLITEDGPVPSRLIAFFKCKGNKIYLAGINGKDIRHL